MDALSSTSGVSTKLAAAELNVKDLSDSLYRTCNTLDIIGANLGSGKEQDCCISGTTAANSGDRDQMFCFTRTTATKVGIDTAATCPVCPSSILSK